jgi:predicted small secreted protein
MKRIAVVVVVMVALACSGCVTLEGIAKSIPLIGDTVSNAEQARSLTRIAEASERQADAAEEMVRLNTTIMEIEAARAVLVVDEDDVE